MPHGSTPIQGVFSRERTDQFIMDELLFLAFPMTTSRYPNTQGFQQYAGMHRCRYDAFQLNPAGPRTGHRPTQQTLLRHSYSSVLRIPSGGSSDRVAAYLKFCSRNVADARVIFVIATNLWLVGRQTAGLRTNPMVSAETSCHWGGVIWSVRC